MMEGWVTTRWPGRRPDHGLPRHRATSAPLRPGQPPRTMRRSEGSRKESVGGLNGGGSISVAARDVWTVIHGMILATLFLLAFAGGLAGLWSLRPEWVMVAGIQERLRRLNAGTRIMAVLAWLTVITGTYIVYPWYRAKAPRGCHRSVPVPSVASAGRLQPNRGSGSNGYHWGIPEMLACARGRYPGFAKTHLQHLATAAASRSVGRS
jgi:hypothetical protein